MAKTNKKEKLLAMMSGIAIGLALAIVAFLVVCIISFSKGVRVSFGEPNPTVDTISTETTEAVQSETAATESVNVQVEEIVVDTPICTLHYPGKWNDSIRTEQLDMGHFYAVHFYAVSNDKETELFTVMFGQGTQTASHVGAIVQNGIATDIFIEMNDISDEAPTEGIEANDMLAMQADVAYLVAKLEESVFFQPLEIKEEDITPDISDAVLDTPYGTLYYPGEWKDAVNWDISSENSICTVSVMESFSGKNAPVFALRFDDQEAMGFQMGTLRHNGRDIAVSLTLCDFPDGINWSEGERSLFLTLQEQAYDMLERFAADNPSYKSILSME